LTKPERAPPKFSKLALFLLSHIKNFNEAKQSTWSKNVFCMCLWTRLKFSKRRSKIRGSSSWYQMKGLEQSEYTVSLCDMKALPSTYQKLWPTLKFGKRRLNSNAEDQRVKVMVSNDRTCQSNARRKTHVKYESPTTYMYQSKVINSQVKDQRVMAIISNERSCQKEYKSEIWNLYHLPIKSYDQG
jgi:hypothetical protein